MAFFDKLSETLTNASNSVAQKTQNFAEVNNLNKSINSNQSVVQNMYQEIGRLYYEAHKQDMNAEYADQCRIIGEALNNICQLQEQVRILKGIAVCPTCGAEISNGSVFCQKCGAQITPANAQTTQNQGAVNPDAQAAGGQVPVNQQTQQPQYKICSKCLSQVPADSAFCPVCGERM